MLVLSRKQSQTIVIGDNIELTVIAVQGGRVKLGITAPRNVSIRRSELGMPFAEHCIARPPDESIGPVEKEPVFT